MNQHGCTQDVASLVLHATIIVRIMPSNLADKLKIRDSIGLQKMEYK